jgi:cyclic pyranopterin phosphate synthase
MYLRVSLTDRCNLRCTYCLPEKARFAKEAASSAEIMALTEAVVTQAGVHKIRLTGGEPTLCDDLLEHVRHAKSLVPLVGMTSNGLLLEPLLSSLKQAGLDRLNISLDGLNAEDFQIVTRRRGLRTVVHAIRRAKAEGFRPLKVNVVAMQQTDVAGFVRFAQCEEIHLRFIELMAIGEARGFREKTYLDSDGIRSRCFEAGISLIPATDRDEPTSRVWTVPGIDPERVSVGFITTASDPFCATCDRLRLDSQGRLFNCLFDNQGVDLLTPYRAGDQTLLRERILGHVAAKAPPAHFERTGPMASIGG